MSSEAAAIEVAPDEVRVSADELQRFTARIFAAAGLPSPDAELVADVLVTTNMRGVDTHGVMRIPLYVRRLRTGYLNPTPEVKTVRSFGATAVLDADDGMGHVATARAMEMALDLADEHGMGCVGVRNSSHFGAAGYYAHLATARDAIGIVCTNGPAVMAPAGGREARLCNNPIAIAVPSGSESDLLLDFAMSVAAGGKIRLAAKEGREIPDHWVLRPDGTRTTNAVEALEGILLPVGDHKGYCLAFAVEVLTGVLMGSAFGLDVKHQWDTGRGAENQGVSRTGHTVIAIPVKAFMDVDEFKGRVDDLVRELRSCPTQPGVESVLVPGDVEQRAWRDRDAAGIPISGAVYESILDVANELGVDAPALLPAEGA